MSLRHLLGFSLLIACVALPLQAQVTEVSLNQRVDAAEIIVEGEVLESTPFLDTAAQMIHTRHRIRVSEVLKAGERSTGSLTEVELVTPGGILNGEWHRVEPSLKLEVGDRGLFMMERHTERSGQAYYRPVASIQGFVRYRANLNGTTATDPFQQYDDLQRDLLIPVKNRLGVPLTSIALNDAHQDVSAPAGGPSISNFSPTTVRGGIQEVLTINGSGFGTQSGSATVFFDNPDDGQGGSFSGINPANIITWTDSQITLFAPRQGTGNFIVRNSAGVDGTSPSILTFQYALSEVVSGGVQRISLENDNGAGGYSFQYSTSTANSGVDITSVPGATDRFEDALDLWNCSTGYNATMSPTTTTVQTTGNDGVNIVSFDIAGDALPSGVLGRASSFYTGCGSGTWFLNGIDIRFKRDGTGANWYFGESEAGLGGSESDFMSTALHEIGHTVQHGHINDPSDLMYYTSITGNSNRTLSAADVAGAQEIISYSNGFASCGRTAHVAFNCTAPPIANFSVAPRAACGSSLQINYTDLSQNAPTSWAWTFGDGGTSTTGNGSWTYNAPGIYDLSMTATNANGSDTLSREKYVIVTTDPTTAVCNPTFSGHQSGFGVGIYNVTLNSINRSSDSPFQGDPLQEDLSCSEMTVLETGMSYPVSVTTGPANDETVSIYIDWNNDGTLAAGELAFSSAQNTVHTGSITPPATAVKNTALRMRVLSDFFAQGIGSACENIDFGQVEEYSVLVQDPVTAEPGEVDNTLVVDKGSSAGSVDLSWGASCGSGADDYSIHEGTIGSWYSHTSGLCSTVGATAWSGYSPNAGDRYFLIVPISASSEGSYGADSGATSRPVSTATCRASQDATVCP